VNERVLIVDDEKKMVRRIRTCLQKEGYLTCEAYDGEAALEVFDLEKPDIVVLDVMMPRLNGLEFCSRVRGRSTTPIIILSARSEEDDKLTGLDLGADDYLTKPFSMHELVARIRALLRRRKMLEHAERDVLAAGPLSIEADERRVTVHLTSRGQVLRSDVAQVQRRLHASIDMTPDEVSTLRSLARRFCDVAGARDANA